MLWFLPWSQTSGLRQFSCLTLPVWGSWPSKSLPALICNFTWQPTWQHDDSIQRASLYCFLFAFVVPGQIQGLTHASQVLNHRATTLSYSVFYYDCELNKDNEGILISQTTKQPPPKVSYWSLLIVSFGWVCVLHPQGSIVASWLNVWNLASGC